MSTIKSKLSDEEKKKVKNLSSLKNTSAKQLTKTVKSGSSTTPIKYNKVSEGEKQKTTAEQIKSEAESYFSNLLNENTQISSGGQEEFQTVKKEVGTTQSGAVSNMPYVDGKDLSDGNYSEPKTTDELFKVLEEINQTYENKSDKDYYEDLLPEVKESLGLQKLDDVKIDEDTGEIIVPGKPIHGPYEYWFDNDTKESV